MLARLLAHPLTRGLDIDAPGTTEVRRRILAEKRFLRRIYQDWYRAIAAALPGGPGDVLEIGSGAGFLRDYVPGLVTSDVLPLPGVDRVVNAEELPFADGALRAVVMNNVLHHIPNVRRFLAEAARSVRPGGVLVMVEPWVTAWSRFVYRRLHHEPFDPAADRWDFPATGPLSGANSALPWIVFARDRDQFERDFPQWRVGPVRLHMPFRYLVSGGISLRSLAPGWAYRPWAWLEKGLGPWMGSLAMFALITVERTEHPHQDGGGTGPRGQ